MTNDVAREELRDHLDGFEHHRAANPDLRPFAADDVLVQSLSGTETEPETSRKHGTERRCGVGDNGGVVAKTGARHGRPEAQARARPERAHERPCEGTLPLVRRPRME